MSILDGKTIVLGVTGGIAAYKSAELVRALVKEGAAVRVVMTRGAREFLTPLTLQTLSGHPVATEIFDLTQESEIGHIRLADSADVLLVAPATANIVAKLAWGIADDLLTTIALATRAPVVVAPAMNVNMLRNRIVEENLARLVSLGLHVVEPEEGFLACGWEGSGRLASETTILERLRILLSPRDLAGERVLVTAGPTREAVDPVRFLSNRSSGKMGYAIAAAVRRRGAEVVLISGPTTLEPPAGMELVPVTSAAEMHGEVVRRESWATAIVMAAAIADYRPARPAARKIKKREAGLTIELERTIDVLAELGSRRRPGRILVGFAAETDRGLENARRKLGEKHLDLIVLNDVSGADAGFDVDTNRVWCVRPNAEPEEWPLLAKSEVADRLAGVLAVLRQEKNQSTSGTVPRLRAPAKRST